MSRAPELGQLYDQIAVAPVGAARLPLINQALALAEEAGDAVSAYALRMTLVESASRADDEEIAVAAFSWVLEQHLADPERFALAVSEPGHADLAWMFKWVVNALARNSAVNRSQIEAALATMELLYTRENLGQSAVATYRLGVAELLGDIERLGELAQAARRAPIDHYSDCQVCTEHWLVSADLNHGHLAQALHQAEQTLKTGRGCLSEPQLMLAELMMPLLEAGETDTVVTYFNRVLDKRWSAASERMSAMGCLLSVAAVTENVALGLELFERWVSDLATVLYDDVARLSFFTGSALVLDRAIDQELDNRPIRDSLGVLAGQGIAEPTETVGSLAPKLWAAADKLATAFDLGRGNSYRRDQLAEQQSWREFSLPLQLGREIADPLIVTTAPRPQTASEWAAYARERLWVPDPTGALAAVDKALALDGLSQTERVDVLGYRARSLSTQFQLTALAGSVSELPAAEQQQVVAAFNDYLAALRAAGRHGRADVLTALGLARYDRDWSPVVADLRAIVERLTAAGTAVAEVALVESYLAGALLEAGEPDAAAEAAITAAEHGYVEAGALDGVANAFVTAQILSALDHREARTWLERSATDPASPNSLRANALFHLARLHGRTAEFAQAASRARQASQLFIGLDAGALAAQAATIAAAALEDAGDLAGAIQSTRRALELSDPVEGYDQLALRIELGRRLVTVGQPSQAVSVLDAADTELYERDLAGSEESFDCAYWLGRAHLAGDNPDAAASLWQLGMESAQAVEEYGRAVTFGRALGNLFADYGMLDKAIEAFEAIREAGELTEDPLVGIGIDERVGLTTCLNSDATGLSFLLRAQERAAEIGADWAFADITDSMARGLYALGRSDEAVAAALSASDAFGVAGDQRGKYGALGYAAAVLTEEDRVLDAISLLQPVATEDEALTAQLADLNLRIGGGASQ